MKDRASKVQNRVESNDVMPALIVRRAVQADLNALSELEILARVTDSTWTYRYPYAADHPSDHRKFNRAKFDTLLNPGSGFEVILAEDPVTKAPVGLSTWQIFHTPWWDASTGSTKQGAMQAAFGDGRRDQHDGRARAFYKVHDAAMDFFFSPLFNVDKYLYLGILAVHPEYQGKGVATELVRWGVTKAKEYPGCKVTLMSSKASGSRLYESRLGFRSIGSIVCKAPPKEDPEQAECRLEMLVWGDEGASKASTS